MEDRKNKRDAHLHRLTNMRCCGNCRSFRYQAGAAAGDDPSMWCETVELDMEDTAFYYRWDGNSFCAGFKPDRFICDLYEERWDD